jgi:hypothetical protein
MIFQRTATTPFTPCLSPRVHSRSNPAGVIAGESAGGNDTMGMGMKLEFLIPGMEHAEEADVSAEMGGVARDFQQGFGAGPE